jgi:peroxiredoxin
MTAIGRAALAAPAGGCAPAAPSLIIQGPQDLDTCERCVGTARMGLREKLDALRQRLRPSLDPEDRAAVDGAIERLGMLQIVEHGLAAGDTLPDFALRDSAGRSVTSDYLLARGPLVVNFFRGGWCPYCSLALQAFDEALPDINDLGAELVAVSPLKPEELARTAEERGLRLLMLSDPADTYAKVCGVHYEMTEGQAALYRKRGLDLDALNAGAGWEVPVPATYVVGRDGVIAYAFADADWSRRAEPAEVLAALRRLVQAADAASAA